MQLDQSKKGRAHERTCHLRSSAPGFVLWRSAGQLIDGLRVDGHSAEIADLRAEGFDPRLAPADEPDWSDADKVYSDAVTVRNQVRCASLCEGLRWDVGKPKSTTLAPPSSRPERSPRSSWTTSARSTSRRRTRTTWADRRRGRNVRASGSRARRRARVSGAVSRVDASGTTWRPPSSTLEPDRPALGRGRCAGSRAQPRREPAVSARVLIPYSRINSQSLLFSPLFPGVVNVCALFVLV